MLEENVTSFETLAAPHLQAARSILFEWAKVVSTGEIEELLKLYAPDAILVPTVSDEVRGADDQRRAYFENFLAKPNLRCEIKSFKKRISHKLGTVVIGGLYDFTFGEDQKAELVPARFLFTFEEINGRWVITGHHSSQLARI
ncbi:nuclear transport factor 2 family protein [Gluconobacter thailandicus]|uniref:DUF4440 domain-containing protein n=1 Tax=Gluconobacter thailandicus TaxID=257438 RepID=A0AAP9JIX3_GLUTH|nr:nuclear transport factor 2 family protein [Gluconobacter thailandicus]QEH97773.1 DUF4440 domain-containing protein [Gluconobacter thailandicus]